MIQQKEPLKVESIRAWFAKKELEVSDWLWEVFDALVDINEFEDDPKALEKAMITYFNTDCKYHVENEALSPWDWCLDPDRESPEEYAQRIYDDVAFKTLLAEAERDLGNDIDPYELTSYV